MGKIKIAGWLLGAALILNSAAVAVAQDGAASASGKVSAESGTSAQVEKAGKSVGPDATGKTAAGAQTATAGSAEIQRGLATLKPGTVISTELDQTIDAERAKPGDLVSAKVTKDVKYAGRTIIRKGDRLLGRVTAADAGAKGEAGSELDITFDQLMRGDDGYQLHTVLSSVITTSSDLNGGMPFSLSDDNMMMPHPAPSSGGGGGRAGGGTLLGGATSTTGSVAGGLAGNADRTTSSALGSTRAAGSASELGSAQADTQVGLSTPLREVRLNSLANAAQSGESTSVLAARRGNLRLESGSRLQFKVSNETQAGTEKK